MGCGCRGRGLTLRRAVKKAGEGDTEQAAKDLRLVARSAASDVKRLAAMARLHATRRR